MANKEIKEIKEINDSQKTEVSWWTSFTSDMRKIRWTTMSKTWKTFFITITVIAVFSLLFFGFDALIGVIFDSMGVL